MKKSGIAVVVLAVLAAGAWWVATSSRGGGSEVPDAGGVGAGGGAGGNAAPEAISGASLKGSTAAPVRRSAHGGGTIEGTVRRDGAPAAARVEVAFVSDVPAAGFAIRGRAGLLARMLDAPASSKAPVATATAGADGRYAVEGLAVGVYRVAATAADGARGTATATLPLEGARVGADVALAAGGETLSGRVVHADGKPWKGTVVVDPTGRIQNPFSLALDGVTTTADDAGRFTATGLLKGEASVSAVEPGVFRATGAAITIPYGKGEYVLVVDAGLVLVHGRVVAESDGSPVAGAEVAAGGQAPGLQLAVAKATTGADGRFEATLATGNRGGLLVHATGYAPRMMQGDAVKDGVEVRLSRGATLSGRVATEDGKPVASVTVTAVPADVGRSGSPFPPEPATSGADGRYEIADLAPGEVTAVAQGDGWVTKGVKDLARGGFNPNAVTLVAGQAATADVVVVRGAKAAGTVTDADGKPVAGAVVRPEPQRGGMLGMGGPMGGDVGGAVTAADGTYEVRSLVGGMTFVLSASAPGYPTVRSGVFPADDSTPAKVDLRFPASRWVVVTVLDDAASTPVEGARVMASVGSGSGNWRGGGAGPWTTGADGTARVGPLEPGPVRFTASHPDYVTKNEPESPADASTAIVRLSRGRVLSGRVVRADGRPAVGVTVSAQVNGPMGYVQPETTDAEGRFRFRAVPAGAVTLSARTYDGKETAQAAAAVDGVTLTLVVESSNPSGQRLTVKVFDPEGKPVPVADVAVAYERGSSSTEARDGVATLDVGDRDPSGHDITVSVWGARTAEDVPLPLGPAKVTGIRPDQREVEVRLPPERVVTGVVRGPDGKGIKGVVVAAMRPGDEGQARWGGTNALARARTDADGAFRLAGLGDDAASLVVSASSDYAPFDPIPVRGGDSNVEIALARGASVTVTVLDPDGAPVVGAPVSAQPETKDQPRYGYRTEGVPTDAHGRALLQGLDGKRTHVLRVDSPSTPSSAGGVIGPPVYGPGRVQVAREGAAFLPFSKAGWIPGDETVTLERAFTVTGIVRDLAGHPVEGAQVARKTGENSWNGVAPTDASGRFTVAGLTAGDVTLRASVGNSVYGPRPEGADDRRVAETTVRAGARDVVLAIDPGVDLVVRVENWATEANGVRWGSAQIYRLENGGSRSSDYAQIGADGIAKFRGLDAGSTYAVWIRPSEAGLTAFRRDLRPGPEVRVRLEAGQTISGRVRFPAGATNANVQASCSEGLGLSAQVGADGRYEIRGVPEGLTWTVGAHAQVGNNWLQAPQKQVPSGGTADLDVPEK